MPIAEFVYNNAKNANISHNPFILNYGYYPQILYKDNVNHYSKFKLADKLSVELRELMIICQENFYHAQEL